MDVGPSHRISSNIVEGLKSQPVLLALVVLNIVGILAAVWFLSELLDQNAERMMILLKNCLPRDLRQ
jgi:hypothetical protein